MSDLNWIAVYEDGECLRECNLDGTINKYADIKRSRLHSFSVYEGWCIQVIRTLFLLDNGVALKDAIVPKVLYRDCKDFNHPTNRLTENGCQLYYSQISKSLKRDSQELMDIPRPDEPSDLGVTYPDKLLLPEQRNHKIKMELDEDKRLIWRKRRIQSVNEGYPEATIYLIGWQTTIDGTNVQSIMYVYPSGQIMLSEGKSDIELFEYEKDLVDYGNRN